jgi:hypothetical protein
MRSSRVVAWALLATSSLPAAAHAAGPGPSLVSVAGFRLMVQQRNPDGSLQPAAPYTVHGVDWSPASRDTPDDPVRLRAEFANWVLTDAPLLQNLGVNTVRVYLDPGLDASALTVLDNLYSRGIMVILTADNGSNDMARVQQVVSFYKDHPAVLMWSLGNEWNVNLYYGNPNCGSPAAAAQCTERAAQLVKSLDANHPVASSYGDIDINAPGLRLADTRNYVNTICASVDLWTANVFRGPNFGNLFDQWRSIAAKPLLIGELGTDALYHPSDLVDEAMQAGWDACLWNDLAAQLSAVSPALVSPGGLAFEWNDEWWKVPPPGQHDAGGFTLIGGHPDDFANEEYFGLVDIDRNLRQAGSVLGAAFSGSSRRPPRGVVFGTASRGTNANQFPDQWGYARFYRCGKQFYDLSGGGGGGRGFNVVALDPATGAVVRQAQNFDTWSTAQLCASDDPAAQLTALVSYLNNVPSGSLVLLSVADDAGLNQPTGNTCAPYAGSSCYANGLAALEALGSTQIRNYCFRDSWAMIAIKGAGHSIAEGLSGTNVVSLLSGLPDPGSFALTVNKSGPGTGTVQSAPAGIACGSGCPSQTSSFVTSTLVALSATAAPGSIFSGWGGDPDCADGVVTVDADKTCTASFVLGLQFFTIAPCRVFDSRGGTRLTSGSERTLKITGACGLPASAKAVSFNVTLVAPTSSGYAVLFPGGADVPLASTINFSAGQVQANNAVLALAADGTGTLSAVVAMADQGTVDLVLDVNGYFE